jgi:hypothetical protein
MFYIIKIMKDIFAAIFLSVSVLITVTDKSFAPEWFFDFGTAYTFGKDKDLLDYKFI